MDTFDRLELDTGDLALLLFGENSPITRRRVRRELEKPPEARVRGIYKRGGRVKGVEEIVRADLRRRATAVDVL